MEYTINEELDIEDLLSGLAPRDGDAEHFEAVSGAAAQDNRVTVVRHVPFDEKITINTPKAARGSDDYSAYVDMVIDFVLDKSIGRALWGKLGSYYCKNGFIIFHEFKRSTGNMLRGQQTRVSIEKMSAEVIATNLRRAAITGGFVIIGETLFDVMSKTIDQHRQGKPWRPSFREATRVLPLQVAGNLITTAAGIKIMSYVERLTLEHSWKLLGFGLPAGVGIVLAVISSMFTPSETIVTDEEEQKMLEAARRAAAKEAELMEALKGLDTPELPR